MGRDYLVLEHIEGQPLPSPLPPQEAVRLALQIAGALEEAHNKGILHRDLKPANIMITGAQGSVEGPVAKLLDFGLARLMSSDADATRTTEVRCSARSPTWRQSKRKAKKPMRGLKVFSFGAVLYEMLSGTRAFGGATTLQVLNSVIRAEAPRLPSAPAVLERIVTRCLAKQPAHRFQTMAEVRAALELAARELVAHQPTPRASIAVLPFASLSADKENEYFGDGLAEEIINALTHIPGLKVIARTSAFAFKDKHQDVRTIAEALGVANVLEGSVRRAGNRLRVTAQLITAADGSHLWSERYDRELTDVFAIQDEIAQAIAGTLKVKLVPKPAGGRHTPTLPAYEALLKGRHDMLQHTVDSLLRAKECFEHAMALDPDYAEPHANLGLNYLLLGSNGMRSLRDTMPLVRAEAREALSLESSEPAPHFLLGAVAAAYEYDWKKAAEHFATAIAGQSVSPETHWAYASFYLQPLGQFQEAVSQMEQAVEQISPERLLAWSPDQPSDPCEAVRPCDCGSPQSTRERRAPWGPVHHIE